MLRGILFTLVIVLFSCVKENKVILLKPDFNIIDGHIGMNDNSTVYSKDHNLIICGKLNDENLLLKCSTEGEILWKTTYPSRNGSIRSVVETFNENIYTCGHRFIKSSENMHSDFLLTKYDINGDTVWSKSYGTLKMEYAINIIETSNGNLLISGIVDKVGHFSDEFDIYMVKTTQKGEIIWTQTYEIQGYEYPHSLTETKNGNYLITGDTPKGTMHMKIDEAGNELWHKTIISKNHSSSYSTIELENGNLLTCGIYKENLINQVFVVQTDKNGNLIWDKYYGKDGLSGRGNSIKDNFDGTFTIVGSDFKNSYKASNIIIFKIDNKGNILWKRKLEGSNFDSGNNLLKSKNGDNIITGNYNIGYDRSIPNTPKYTGSIFITKVDNNGHFIY